MSDAVTTDQLLAAVEDCLRQDILPTAQRDRERYLLRVCANALGMARRDLAAASDMQNEALCYQQLAGSNDPENARQVLAQGLRNGTIDAGAPGLIAALKALALARARRANPAFKPAP